MGASGGACSSVRFPAAVGVTLAGMTPSDRGAGSAEADNGGDVYLTDAGIDYLEWMLDTLDIAPDRWIDRPVLSGRHIRQHPDGSGSADLRLQLTGPPEVIEVLQHQFAVGHIDHIDLDEPTDPS